MTKNEAACAEACNWAAKNNTYTVRKMLQCKSISKLYIYPKA